jgi:hypothetical protein
MIQLTVVSRVNEDKNFFFDVIFALYKLKLNGIGGVHLLFVGDILSRAVYDDCSRLARLLDLSDTVVFTGRSVRITDLPEPVKDGYFVNFTIADFTGYSGVESVSLGYKTIFYNIDQKLAGVTPRSASMCPDIESFVSLITGIVTNRELTDRLILEDNLRIKSHFLLSEGDRVFLRSTILPGNTGAA